MNEISLKFVPKGPIDNKSALVHVMDWSRTGRNTLPEPMLTQFTDAYMRHYRKTSNISRTLVGNNTVDHSDVVGASPVDAAPTTSSFST